MKEYVAGFLFNHDLSQVALIRKNKPEWQNRKLNGIGGKIEPTDACPADAMVREFKEEASMVTFPRSWRHYATLNGKNKDGEDFIVYFFARRCFGTLSLVKTATDEIIEKVDVSTIAGRTDLVDNLAWLLGAAINVLKDGRPNMITANYI